MVSKTQTEIQKDYDERRKAEGLIRVTVWIPRKCKPELVSIATRMRFNHETE